MKNIYCAGAIKGDTKFRNFYEEIIRIVNREGFIALTELNIDLSVKKNLSDKEIYKRDIGWLTDSSKMIAEVSGASLGVGYEIAYALNVLRIPVLALFHNTVDKASAMITGCSSPLLQVMKYEDNNDLENKVVSFLNTGENYKP